MNPEYAERVIADVADTSTVLPSVIAAIAVGKYKEAGEFMTEDVILDIKGFDRMNLNPAVEPVQTDAGNAATGLLG